MIRRSKMLAVAGTIVFAVALAVGGGESKASPAGGGFQRLATVNASAAAAVAMARTSDGTLHLVYQTFAGRSFSGLAIALDQRRRCRRTAGAGALGMAGRAAGPPGAAERHARGCLRRDLAEQPRLERLGDHLERRRRDVVGPRERPRRRPNEALAYGSNITAAMTGTSPVLSLPQAGNLVVQTGLGSGSPSIVVTNSANGSTTDADLAVDAATGEVVASWPSVAPTRASTCRA